MDDVRTYLSSSAECKAIDRIYGVNGDDLGEVGPSVAPLNAVVVGHAAVEFMVAVTGMRAPTRTIRYRGNRPLTSTSRDGLGEDCHYCKEIWGAREDADVERYLRISHLEPGRRPAQRTQPYVET